MLTAPRLIWSLLLCCLGLLHSTNVILIMISEATMLGLLDLESLNLIANFVQDVLKADASLELIPISVRLLYLISQQNVLLSLKDNGQGEICSGIPNFLNVIIKVIVEQAREEEKKPFFVEEESAVKQVLSECKQYLSEVVRIYFAHPILQADGVLREIVASMMAASIAEISTRLSDGKELNPCSSVTDLPIVTAFLLTCVCRTQALMGIFVGELEQCTSAGATPGVHGILAVLHMLHPLAKSKKKVPGIKDCVTAVQKELATQVEVKKEQNTTDDGQSPLYTEAEDLAKEILTAIGAVA